jgi:hypothetical protein
MLQPVLRNRNYFLQFRFRLLISFGSDFWQVGFRFRFRLRKSKYSKTNFKKTLPFYKVSLFTRKKCISFIKFIEVNQIHNYISSSGSGIKLRFGFHYGKKLRFRFRNTGYNRCGDIVCQYRPCRRVNPAIECLICGRNLKTEPSLREHMRLCHGVKTDQKQSWKPHKMKRNRYENHSVKVSFSVGINDWHPLIKNVWPRRGKKICTFSVFWVYFFL